MISKKNYDLRIVDGILLTNLKGYFAIGDVVLTLFSDVRDIVIESGLTINKLITDARKMEQLVAMPTDFETLPILSKDLEEKELISKQARHAFMVSHEDHLLAAQLLSYTFPKFGIEHEIKPYNNFENASTWLGIDIVNYIPAPRLDSKENLESSFLSRVNQARSII